MAQKRHFEVEGDENCGALSQEPKRRYTFKTAVRDVMRELSLTEFLSRLEPFLRRVVREEVELAIIKFFHSSPSCRPPLEAGTSGQSVLRLDFVNTLPSSIFTNSRIEAEDGTALQIVLYDANSQTIVQSGPLSSAKIEIFALNGDFGSDDLEDWTEKEFNAGILREREGKRPLVTGELNIVLENGIGYIRDISFTDNSSWIRSKKFRLGAKIGQQISEDIRVREARSRPFKVKDHRGEVYKKHYPPSLKDEVWRLEKIGKDGAFRKRLASYGINTVKDFLQLYEVNSSSLRSMFDGIADRAWQTIVDHAKTCVIDDHDLYMYHARGHGVILLLNSIYRVVGATFDGKTYPVGEINLFQRPLVEDLKRHAYENLTDLVLVDEQFAVDLPMPNLQDDLLDGPSAEPQLLDLSIINQDTNELLF